MEDIPRLLESLPNRLYRYRNKEGMTQSKLASKLNVSSQLVSAWEKGTKTPTLDSLLKFCEIYGVSLDELLGIGTDDEAKLPDELVLKINEHKMNNKFGKNHNIQILNKKINFLSDAEVEHIESMANFFLKQKGIDIGEK